MSPCEEPNHYVLEDGECLDCRALPCMARGRSETSDGPVRDVDCDLQHGHTDRHWDESEFTFWAAS